MADDPRDIAIRPIDRDTAGAIEASSRIGGVRIENFLQLVEVANMMARSGPAVRPYMRNNVGCCFAVATQALEWGMSPFAVAQKSYMVNDIIAYEAQLIAALVITRAPITEEPDYLFEGEGAEQKCTVSIKMKSGKVLKYTSPTVAKIHPKNSPLWKSDQEQQLGYYSIRAWARRHAPNAILGVYAADELEGIPGLGPDNAKDVTPPSSLVERISSAPKPGGGFDAEQISRTLGGGEASTEKKSPPVIDNTSSESGGVPPAPDAAAGSHPPQVEPAAATISDAEPAQSDPGAVVVAAAAVIAVDIPVPTDGRGYPEYARRKIAALHTEDEIKAWHSSAKEKKLRNSLPNIDSDVFEEIERIRAARVQELQGG